MNLSIAINELEEHAMFIGSAEYKKVCNAFTRNDSLLLELHYRAVERHSATIGDELKKLETANELLQRALAALNKSSVDTPYEGFGMLFRQDEREHNAVISDIKDFLKV